MSHCRIVVKGTFLAMYEALGIWHVPQRDKTLSRTRVYTYSPSPDLGELARYIDLGAFRAHNDVVFAFFRCVKRLNTKASGISNYLGTYVLGHAAWRVGQRH